MHKPLGLYELDQRHPLVKNLVGAWLFDKQTGRFVEDLTGNNHGNIVGDSVVRKPLSQGLGVDFSTNSSFDRVDLGLIDNNNPLSLNGKNTVTIISRIKYQSFDVDYSRIFENYVGSVGYMLRFVGQKLSFYSFSPSFNVSSVSDISVGYNDLAFVRRPSNLEFYINKKFDSSFLFGGGEFLSDNSKAVIGNSINRSDRSYNGGLDYLYVFDVDLSPKDIISLQKNPYQILKSISLNVANTIIIQDFSGVGTGTLSAITADAVGAVVSPDFSGVGSGTLSAIIGSAEGNATGKIFTATGAGVLSVFSGFATDLLSVNLSVVDSDLNSIIDAYAVLVDSDSKAVLSRDLSFNEAVLKSDQDGNIVGYLSPLNYPDAILSVAKYGFISAVIPKNLNGIAIDEQIVLIVNNEVSLGHVDACLVDPVLVDLVPSMDFSNPDNSMFIVLLKK